MSLSWLLVSALLFTSLAPSALAIKKVSPPNGKVLIAQTDYTLANGVTESEVFLNDAGGNAQIAGYMLTVEPDAKATFKASYKNYYTAGSTVDSRKNAANNLKWGLESTTDQAAAYERATGGSVIAATNGDYYNMQTGQPLGYLIMEGNLVQRNNGSSNEPYFAVLKDGSFEIREPGADCSDVQEAISGPFYLVRGGQVVVDNNNTDLMPRNSIGVKADGTVMSFVADGRQYPYSVGMTIYDLACYYQAQGAENAIYLDGGGSATFASKHEGTSRLEVRNRPSDGVERTVSSALLLVSTADQDGVFDHASIEPNNRLYTPNSTVRFSASGVDAAGGPAELPEDVVWTVENGECGAIDENGWFTPAEDYRGDVTVQLVYENNVVGSTTVSIADVTELSFSGDSISLDFGAESDLGLTVKSNGRDIVYKDGDFEWTVDPETIGSVDGNLFTAVGGTSTLTGDVTVAYTYDKSLSASISVEIGKMPVVLMDFEPNENGPLTGAHYHWGKSTFVDDGTTEGYRGNVPSVEVITRGTYSDNPTRTTLQAPFRFTGNWDSAVPAADIFRANGYTFYLWPNTSITTYNVGTVKTSTEDDGGHVRFGDYSLELNYDYSSYNGEKNSNFYVRYCGDQIKIEGYPTQIGVWVYVPEGSWEYVMYADLMHWNGSDYETKNIQLYHAKNGDTGDTSEGNITAKTDWSGWRYCYADVGDYFATYQNAEHPISIIPGQGLFWLSYQPGGDAEFKGRKNGSVFYDNYRVVYGTNLDDLDNPMVDSITVNGLSLEEDGSTVIETNTVEIETKYHDVNGANKSGIEASSTVILIDGREVTADKAADSALSRLELTNGHHVATVRVYDAFGNAGEMSRGFTVYNGKEEETSTVSIAGDSFVPLGGDYTLKVVSTEDIQSAQITLANLNADIGEPDVTVAYGWKLAEKSYQSTGFKKASLTLKLEKENTPSLTSLASLDDLLTKNLAELTFHIDKNLDTTVNSFTYTPTNITYVGGDGTEKTAALPAVRLELSAFYTLKPGIQIEGMSSTITVLKKDGTPASGVTVYLNGTAIGQTNDAGQLETGAMKQLAALTEYVLSADGPQGVAEAVKATVLTNTFSEEEPFKGIHLNASTNGSTEQSISFLSDPTRSAASAYAKYRAAGTEAEWETVSGTSTLTNFSTSKDGARVNTIRITGLTPGTAYEFQVGDGEKWSDVGTFRTVAASNTSGTSFFVMGDTQMSGNPESADDQNALQTMRDLSAILQDKKVDFGLQTGDYVDNGSNLAMWQEMQDAFSSCYPATDIIHTLGNHEYYGNPTGEIANDILQLPGRDYYSVEYGDVYVAVINNSADLDEACQWLIRDAAGSSCQWKILSIHQPPYYTNANGGSQRFNKAVPSAAEEAGIDVVFSGHDHAYARTPMFKGGQSVKENGVVYFICGDLGEKSRNVNYAITSDFEYEHATQDYTGLMLYVTAEDGTLTITAYDSANSGSILDQVVLSSACGDGHDYTLYDKDSGKIICSRCGHEETPEALNFTGELTVKGTDDRMYFVSGQYKTGWFTIGATTYHFSDEGIMHDTTTVDTRTCTKSGVLVTTCNVCNARQTSQALWPEGHAWNDDHVCTRCGTVGKDISKAVLKVYNATMDDPRAAVSATYEGTALVIKSSQVNCDGYVTYANNTGVGMGTVTITGEGDFYGTISAEYKINPSVVKSVNVDAVGQDSVDLSWPASKGATKYRVEISRDGGSTWAPVSYPVENKVTITGLDAATSYAFRLYGYTYVDGVAYSAPQYSPAVTAVTSGDGAPTTQERISDISVTVSGMKLPMQTADGKACLFLPACADMSSLPLTFTVRGSESGTIKLTGDAGSVTLSSLSGTVDMTEITGGAGGQVMVSLDDLDAMPVYVMQSGNISALYITSDDAANEGRNFVDASKSNKTTAQMKLVGEDGTVVYDGALTQVKARGNTTFVNAEKKSYQIKLSNKTDLIGCGEKIKTWVLLAGYFDATKMHDKVFKDLAAGIGMSYVPNSDWVDLYYDGEYRGTYLLGEKNSVGKTGVDITDMEDAYSGVNPAYGSDEVTSVAENRFGCAYQYTENLTEPENITGGYLLELSLPAYDEASGFKTIHGGVFNVKSPEWCGKEAMAYISEYYQEFENAVYATDENGSYTGYNEETGKYYYEYCDLTSLVQMYLIQELANNVDGFYSSFYFYKDADGIMYAGPVWDMESTAGSGWAGWIRPSAEFINGRYLANALTKIPGFMEAVGTYYNETFRTAAGELIGENGILARNGAHIADSATMNYVLWPYIKAGNPTVSDHLWPDGTTYSDVVDDMIFWVKDRIAVLDETYPDDGPITPVEPTDPVDPTQPPVSERVGYSVYANYYTNGVKDNSARILLMTGSAEIGERITLAVEDVWSSYNSAKYTLSDTDLTLVIGANEEDNTKTLRYDRTASTDDSSGGGGGGSSGGGGSASGGTKTETTVNPDGSTTKTETKADGTTVETTTATDGSTGTITTDKSGTKTEIEVKISDKAVEEAEKKDAPVTAPIEVKAGGSSNSAPTIKIELPKNADETKVEIPVSNVTSGTVAVIVHEDGTEEIVKTSVVTENGVALDIKGSATVKIVDNSKEFLDTKNHWSREEVNFVASRELFNGIGNNLFGVSGSMTRGMVTTVLARLAGENTDGGVNWYDKGTEWAMKNGISDGTNPTGNITREQIAAMLYRFAGSPAVGGTLGFADVDQISDYANEAMLWAVQNGILNGIGNNLAAPQSTAERAQVAAMMARYIKNVG